MRAQLRSDAVTEVERPWIEALDELGVEGVYDLLLHERGLPPTQSAAIVFWLREQRARQRFTSRRTATNYRRILAGVAPPGRGDLGVCSIGGLFNLAGRAA